MAHAEPARRRWIGALGFALALVLITTYYVFVSTAGQFDQWPELGIDHPYFYDSQAEGFRAGHLYTTLAPHPELLRRPDPYDLRNIDVWYWDYSLYREHLYLYWGLAPAVLLAAIKSLLDDGVIAQAGLSGVSVQEIEAARKVFPVATVQNRYNLITRDSEDVLDHCTRHGIGFIPWYPLAAGDLAKPGSLLDGIAKKHKATPAQIALAWILKRSPVMLPIPGTGKVRHLEENVAAADIALSDEDFAALDQEGRRR